MRTIVSLAILLIVCASGTGCATIRTTDPPRTATEQFLLGIPALYLPQATSSTVPIATPELAIIKSTKQRGYASVAYVAYWADTGEVVAHSGPFIGRTTREDWWILGTGPRTVGDIPPAEK